MKDSNFNLPTPQLLISNAKETTVPVSLRVKKSTVDIFDKIAAEAGTNRGTMMNTLLDFYAQNLPKTANNNAKKAMLSFLESSKFWQKLPELSPEELIFRIINKNIQTPEADSATSLLEAYNKKDYDLLIALIDTKDDDRIMDSIEAHTSAECHKYTDFTELCVTHEQWPLVVVLLGTYSQKYMELFPEQKYSITPAMYEKITEACKRYSKPNSFLASEIKNILSDFVETQND